MSVICSYVNGDALSCGLARLHGFIGGKPIQVTVSHGPGIEPCRCSGNPAYQRDLMRRHERRRGAMVIPRQAGLTGKALSPDKTVLGEAEGVYGPPGNSPLDEKGERKGP